VFLNDFFKIVFPKTSNTITESFFSCLLEENLKVPLLLNPFQLTIIVSSPGNWNNNSSYASIHTQSTRSGIIGDGGSFGGMDDRFDFIFFTDDLVSGANKLTYVPNSYTAVGNDGNHFNKSINSSPINTSAPTNVIDALYIMSDHLPIALKAYVPLNVGIEEETIIVNWKGFSNNGAKKGDRICTF